MWAELFISVLVGTISGLVQLSILLDAMPVQELCKVEFPEYKVSLVIKYNLPVSLNP